MNKHILLISYIFPPYPDVGSRRWAKFAKYLTKDGFKVHVIAAKSPFTEKSLWNNDIKHKNISLHYLPTCYPKILMFERRYLWQKIIARVLIYILKLFTKGIVYDFAIFWQRPLHKEAIRLIKEYKIENAIVTGPPFRVPYYTALLKNKFPGINIISDLRDIWLDGKLYCLDKLSGKTLQYEAMMEGCVIQNSDHVTFSDENISDKFKEKYLNKTNTDKFITLPHAYDTDNYSFGEQVKPQIKNEKIIFAFGGAIPMMGIRPIIIPLFDTLKLLKENRPEIYNRLSFRFYIKQLWASNLFKKYNLDIISFHDQLPENKYFQVISQADFLMIFLPDHLNDYRISKFYEYLPLKKPIIVFSNIGKASRYIAENKIGYAFTPDNYYNNLIRLIEDYDNHEAIFNPNFNYAEFSFESVTKKLELLFK